MPAAYLKIGGDLIKDAILVSVEIVQELNEHWWCTVECRQTEDKRFPFEDWLGKDVQVVTCDQEGAEHTVFSGFVLESELEYEVYGSYTARMTCVSKTYKMDLTPRQAYYRKKTFIEMAQLFGKNVGLDIQLLQDNTITPSEDYVQWGETDFEFLRGIVDDYVCWMRPKIDGIEINNLFQQGTTLQWRGESGEKGLLSFKIKGRISQPSFNGATYIPWKMESRTYTEVREEAVFSGASGPLVDSVKQQSRSTMFPGYLYDRRRSTGYHDGVYVGNLQSESVRSIGSKIIGYGVSRNSELYPGNYVDIQGVLDAHGKYGVVKVIHRWIKTGYTNEFWCTPWNQYQNPERPKRRLFFGITPARVVNNADPEGMGRVQVQYYWQEDGQTNWIRMMTPHAGADRGFYFMPEVGDEVVVAFEEGDPERPVVLGSIWNGVDRAPTEAFWGGEHAGDDVKRIVTKSGHRIQLVDKSGKESIVVATPNYLKISMIEKTDETGRSAILIHSENGDIILSAPDGRVHIHSKLFSREVG